ncbi:MAG: hypothetical protein HZB26_21905 [Candidatus Hydrogenedentes bacterium]|nr:hypothetical protein [Candidatus Hydrogenedentota bacterium]
MNSLWYVFWVVVAVICVAWYTVVTVYVAVRGASDIRGMLARLKATESGAAPPVEGASPPRD